MRPPDDALILWFNWLEEIQRSQSCIPGNWQPAVASILTQADHKKRVEIRIGAAYGTNPNVVMKILYDAAMEYKYTHKNPEPLPLFDEFADSSLNFRLLFWVPVDSVLVSKSDVSIDIYNRFEAAGIQIPFPQQDVNIIQKEQNTEPDT